MEEQRPCVQADEVAPILKTIVVPKNLRALSNALPDAAVTQRTCSDVVGTLYIQQLCSRSTQVSLQCSACMERKHDKVTATAGGKDHVDHKHNKATICQLSMDTLQRCGQQ